MTAGGGAGGFNVSTEALRSHSRTVEGVAGDVGTAAEAAQTEGYGGMVYGVLFDVVALAWLKGWSESMHTSMAAAGKAGHAISQGLSLNAQSYDSVEQNNKGTISGSGGH